MSENMGESDSHDFLYEISDWDPAKIAEFYSYFKRTDESISNFVRNPVTVGPKGYTLFQAYRDEASKIYNMEIKSTDTVVATMPRSGTTWTQEIVWLIANDLDFCKARSTPLMERFPVMGTTFLSKCYENTTKMSTQDNLLSAPDPRFIKTHLPFSLLPPKLLDKAKVVYVARDPRDVCVSQYFLLKLLKTIHSGKDFKTFWRLFKNGYLFWQPYFEHVKEAWEARHHPNMLFLFYEDLIKDLPNTLKRVAIFFNKNYTDEQISELCEFISFDNFKNNRSVNVDLDKNCVTDVSAENSFIRKGKVGAWRQHFDEEMITEAQQWINENLRDTDLRYPSMENEYIN